MRKGVLQVLVVWFLLARLLAVEVREADGSLSGRLSSKDYMEASFGQPVWGGSHGFRRNDYLVGSLSSERNIDAAVVFAFRIDEAFVQDLESQTEVSFIFTLVREHEGNAKNVLPLDVYLLKPNSKNAREAAESEPVAHLGTITEELFKLHHTYRYRIPDASLLKAGDVIWIGLNGRNVLDDINHNIVIGGDLITFPGTVSPMLVAGETEALTKTIQGVSFLSSLNQQIRAPSGPVALSAPVSSKPWLSNPLTSSEQFKKLNAVHKILQRELKKLPYVRRFQRESALGFHSSIKPLEEGWKFTIPVDGVASAVALLPVLQIEDDQMRSVYFPRRFVISASLESQEKVILADWSQQDFPLRRNAPVIFSFPWMHVNSIEVEIVKGVDSPEGHFFALEEVYLYRPEYPDKTFIEIPSEDSLEIKNRWSARYLTDGVSSLGTTLSTIPEETKPEVLLKVKEEASNLPPEIIIDLRTEGPLPIWSLDFFPVSARGNKELNPPAFPVKLTVDLANDSDFRLINYSQEFEVELDDLPRGGQPLHLTFPRTLTRFIRIRIQELSSQDKLSDLGIAEIRFNGGHGFRKGVANLRGFANALDVNELTNDLANGFRLDDPLAAMMGVVRRDIVQGELSRISASIEHLQNARRRTNRFIGFSTVIILLISLVAVYLWQRRKGRVATYRVRRQIQQDLHDEIGSSLSTISLVSSHILEKEIPDSFQYELADINLCAREATASLREVIWMTDKQILTLDKCFSYMKIRAEQMVRDSRLELQMPKIPPAIPIPSNFKRNLFLFFAEAIQNARKHSSASLITIRLGYSQGEISIEVSDDGSGFDLKSVREGIGMTSLKQRAKSLDGVLEMDSCPDRGTRVLLNVNLPAD